MGSSGKKPLICCIVLLAAVLLSKSGSSMTVKDIIQKYGKYEIRNFIRDTAPDRQITIQLDNQLYAKQGRQDIDFLTLRSIEADFRRMGLSPADADKALKSYKTGTKKTAAIESVIYGNDEDTINAVLKLVSAQKIDQFSPTKIRKENVLNATGVFKNRNYPDPKYPLESPVTSVADLVRKYGKYNIRNFVINTAPDKQTTIQLENRFYLRHGLQDVQYVTISSIKKDLNRLALSLPEADKALSAYVNSTQSGTGKNSLVETLHSKRSAPRKRFVALKTAVYNNRETALIEDMIERYGKYDIRDFIRKTDPNNQTSIQIGNQFFLKHGRHDTTYITVQSIERDFNRIGLSPREAEKALKIHLERKDKSRPFVARRDQQGKKPEKADSFNAVVNQIFASQIIDDASFSDGLGYIIFQQNESYFGTAYQIHKIATIASARLFHEFQLLKSIKMLVLLNFDTDYYKKGLYILNADRQLFESEYGLKFNDALDFQEDFVKKYASNKSVLHFGKKFINHVATGESGNRSSNPGDKQTEL